jgi:preprotein translocase SecE subunit
MSRFFNAKREDAVAEAEQDSNKRPKRRLRAAPETMRDLAQKTTLKAEKNEADSKKSRRKLRKPKAERAERPKRKVFAPFRFIWRPVAWIGRHIIPGYFKSAFKELRLTVWPNRRQSRQLTTAVVLFAVVFGTFVFVLDYGLDKVFKELFVK